MIILEQSRIREVFVPDRRFTAYKKGYRVAIRWHQTVFIDNVYQDHRLFRNAAEKLWGYAYSWDNPRYAFTEERFYSTWTITLYLPDEKSYTLLRLAAT